MEIKGVEFLGRTGYEIELQLMIIFCFPPILLWPWPHTLFLPTCDQSSFHPRIFDHLWKSTVYIYMLSNFHNVFNWFDPKVPGILLDIDLLHCIFGNRIYVCVKKINHTTRHFTVCGNVSTCLIDIWSGKFFLFWLAHNNLQAPV